MLSASLKFTFRTLNPPARGKPPGSQLCPPALPTLRGSEMMSFFLSDPRGGRGVGMASLSARGLSALIKRSVFRRISWFLPRGQDFSGSECAGCCAGRREDPLPIQLKAALETLMRGRKPQDNTGNKYFPPSIISFYIFSPPHPLPLLSFWFLVRFLSSFAVTSVRLLFPWRRLVSLPAQIALKHPIQQKKREPCFLAWVAEGGRERRSLLGPHS